MKAAVYWITGIPAAGKTTLARKLVEHFRALGRPAEIVDGDDIRKVVSAGLGFSKEDRLENNRRIAWIARLLARNGVMAFVASVSPYREGREEARRQVEAEGIRFVEIYVACDVLKAKARDSREVYTRNVNVTGAGGTYEDPKTPDIRVDSGALDAYGVR